MERNGKADGKTAAPNDRSVGEILVMMLIGSTIMAILSSMIGSVFSVIYHPDSSVSFIWIIVIVGSTLFLIVSQIITHINHGKAMMPLYLIASFMIAIWFYTFLVAIIVGPILLAMLAFGVHFHESVIAFPVRITIPALMIVVILYGAINARYLRRRYVKVRFSGTRKDPVKIALISDLHLGLMVGKHRLDAILSTLKDQKPDIIISAGDLIDTNPRFLGRFEPFIKDLVTIAPVYAVTGNHEFYNGNQDCIDWMGGLGVIVLQEEKIRDMGSGLDIIGVSDPSAFGSTHDYRNTVLDLVGRQSGDHPFILVNHQPLLFREVANDHRFLQLSGHTHAGQIWPFGWGTRLMFKEGDRGLHEFNGSYMYVCTGTGTWGPPMRVGTESQMVFIDLI